MIARCYLEITNICNLDCVFCAKTKRKKAMLSSEEFDQLTDKLRGKIQFLYFHLMGETFLHPQLPQFISLARQKGFTPVLTTNGTQLKQAKEIIQAKPYKIQISLHAHEGNPDRSDICLENYVEEVIHFSKEAAANGIIVILRLWNQGGYDSKNGEIEQVIAKHLPQAWTARHDGWKLSHHIYLEYDHIFQWPDSQQEKLPDTPMFCYALRNQVGVLVDGSVVPCCLDHEGDILLGNLFKQDLEEILDSPRARAIYEGFSQQRAVEDLCQRCGYAKSKLRDNFMAQK